MNGQELTNPIEKTETMNLPVVPATFRVIRPVVRVEEALEAWKEYQALKEKLADKGDFVEIQGKQHPTKQFANKLSKFFGLSVQIIRAEKETDGEDFTWHIWVRATAPNGQFRESDGHCSSKERKFSHLEHDVYATAVTRAKNRAILELAGFGEVSAEEILDDEGNSKSRSSGQKPASRKLINLTLWDGRQIHLTYENALKQFAAAKKAVGEENYYELLGSLGFEHANEIPSEKMSDVFDRLVTLWKQLMEARAKR